MSKTILITGGAGFIAHHVIEEILNKTDWNVISLDRLDFSGNLNRLQDIVGERKDKKRVKVVYHDLKAPLNSQIISSIGKVDYIAHLAAGSHVDRSIDYPMEFVLDNVVGTANILDYAKSIDSLDKFVYFSTDEVFGPAPKEINYKENDRYNSTNPYSATKAGAEELVVAYENTYRMPNIITHTMNVFGERQHPEKFIPMCINKILKGEKIFIHGNKEKTLAGSRHYIHAKDVADALLFLLQNNTPSVADETGIKCPKFNIVGSEEIDNLSLALYIADVLDKKLNYEIIDFHSSRPGHDLRYALCGNKMKQMGWTPSEVYKKLKETVKWTVSNNIWLKI
ncbi:GDP-mannose 4,6-dehydratase [Planktomarina sp.]|uniref:dTDP-glucose 4,6-dehydratase n=1 Tax=Planktomarina sp. TaxID=2024851 RepID=UPI003260FDCE